MTYKLSEIIDIELFQNFLDQLHEIYGFPSSIVANDGTILTASGWQEICTRFHRKHPESEKLCRQSDRYIQDHIHEAHPAVSYRCRHGLMDTAAPIVIDGVGYGIFFTGQYFLEAPDPEAYKARARQYGFDENAYLQALDKVPIWSAQKRNNCLYLIKGLIALIEASGKKKLQELADRRTLAGNEDRYRSIMQTTMDGFWLADADGRLLEVNDTYCAMIGYTRAELLNKHISSLEDALDHRSLSGHLAAIKAKGADRFETRHRRKDGTLMDLEISIQFRTFEGGRFVCFLRDITSRNTMAAALEKRLTALTQPLDDPGGIEFEDLFDLEDIQRLQDQFAQATGVASIITRPDGTPITAPSNFCRLCSEVIRKTEIGRANCFRSDAVLGRLNQEGPTLQPCLSGGLWDAGAGIAVGGRHLANWLIGQVRDETQTESKMRAYAREIGADEDTLIEAFRQVPAMSREQFGHVSRVLFTMANQLSTLAYQNVQQGRLISALKRSEEEQKQLQSRLMQAQKMESVGRLAGGIAHDFNNMLSIIHGNAELMTEDLAAGSALVDPLRDILEASRHSMELTRQLLAFARKQTVAPKVMDLNETIASLLRMLGRLIGEAIELSFTPCADIWAVRMDPSQVNQILTNLCANARDVLQGVGSVAIETANVSLDAAFCTTHVGVEPGDYVCMSVRDTGHGMDRGTLDNLFEPFFTTKDLGKGTGLGLATVYGIVQQNSGAINVDSEPGQGTTFKIFLPRHRRAPAAAQNRTEETSAHRGGETILLVEDEEGLLRMSTLMLRRLGYNVLAAGGPREALRISEDHSEAIDLLMTDVVMPEMSGRELATALVAARPGLKVLYCSGYTDDVIAHHGVLEEGIHFINKPFSIQTLSEKLREVLARHASGPYTPL